MFVAAGVGQAAQSNSTPASRLKILAPDCTFSLVEEMGPPHSKTFVFCVSVHGRDYIGTGKSKKLARHQAAALALRSMLQAETTPTPGASLASEQLPFSGEF